MTNTHDTDSNLPAVVQSTEREVAKTDTDSWIRVAGDVTKLATYIAPTEFVPRSLRDSAPAVAAAILYGREVGLPPMTALTQTHVIEGKPALSASAKRALVLAAGHEIETLESTGAICRMRARRRGSDRWGAEVIWTLDMARAAGLLGKNVWKSYPRAMLLARCSGELCDRDFPDVVLGFATIEDLEDMGGEETAPAETSSTTKVSRRTRKTAAPPAAIPPAAARPSTAPAGPPLPGEDGTPDVVPDQTSAASDDIAPASHAAGDGKDLEDAADVADPEAEVVVEDVPVEDPPAPDEVRPARRALKRAPAKGADGKSSQPQRNMIYATLGELGVDDVREERLLIASKIANRPIDSFNDLTKAEAGHIIDTLAQMKDKAELWSLLDAIDDAAAGGQS